MDPGRVRYLFYVGWKITRRRSSGRGCGTGAWCIRQHCSYTYASPHAPQPDSSRPPRCPQRPKQPSVLVGDKTVLLSYSSECDAALPETSLSGQAVYSMALRWPLAACCEGRHGTARGELVGRGSWPTLRPYTEPSERGRKLHENPS